MNIQNHTVFSKVKKIIISKKKKQILISFPNRNMQKRNKKTYQTPNKMRT